LAVGYGTSSGCLQLGHFDCRPANSGLTFSFVPQWEHEKAIMGSSRLHNGRSSFLGPLPSLRRADR
jgi:hypothetical protein